MLNKYFVTALLGVMAFLSACRQTYDINISEALQLPASAQLYTNCNIFYQNPQEIDPRNVHKGEKIPFGTAVQIISASNKEIVFRTVSDAKAYRLSYDQSWMMIPVENYLPRYFSAEPLSQQLLTIPEAWRAKALAGIVEHGMPRSAVLKAWGYPVSARTPDLKADTWLYYDDYENWLAKRVIFQDDKVVEFLKLK